ncbi:hypothetical protein AB6A40_010648 [Gnathostoma spinigerum]|uniref:Uncharacterized protein n=1 Tax=Gnathostoma spinigerum TaxID=75299 RepID=A0ABD6EVE9_9BILA
MRFLLTTTVIFILFSSLMTVGGSPIAGGFSAVAPFLCLYHGMYCCCSIVKSELVASCGNDMNSLRCRDHLL